MATARAVELTPGMSVDGWRVDARIAIGGFGTVWKVTHTETAAPAALKVLHADMVASEELTQRFEREARALQLIGCDNVARLFGVGALPDGRPFQVVEFIDGADLAHRISERGPLSLAETDEVSRQICRALSAAHAAGIVHRDVKASNVMLGAGSRVVLLDFGIAKFTAPGVSALTASRCAVGTPSYMSPEQIRGEPIDGRADVYAVGALIHHMLTGERVFGSASRVTTQYLHLHGRRPRPSDLIDVPPAVDDVVVKAMAKRRGDRFPTVDALYDAFHAAIAATADDGGTPQRALAAYVEVDAPADLMSDPDDALIDDYDEVIPAAVDALCERGFELAWAASNAALLLCAVRDAAERRRAAAALIAVYRELTARPARHPAVHVGLCASLGDAVVGSDHRAAGPLTDVAAWLPAPPRRGMLAPEAALEGVECDVDRHGKWYRLREDS